MFADNSKISGRQLKRVVVLDLIGKAGLLLPRFTDQADGRSFIISLLIGVALALFYAWILEWLSRYIDRDFYGYIKDILGGGAAWLVSILYLCYLFVNCVYIARLFAVVAVHFMLPEASQIPFMIMVLIAGMYIAGHGLESGGRIGEILYGIILLPLAIMLFFAVFSIDPEYLQPRAADYTLQMVKHGLQMFTVFGGMGVFLFVAPNLSGIERHRYALRKGILVTGVSVLLIFLVAVGTFGESGMRALPWPALTLMSSVDIPGGFLQRWDIIFTGLLLVTFFLAMGTGMFCMDLMTEKLLKKKNRLYIPLLGVIVLGAAVWCGSYETATQVYVTVNGYILIPIAVTFTLFLVIIEHVRRRKKR